jgi:hypothetical protein
MDPYIKGRRFRVTHTGATLRAMQLLRTGSSSDSYVDVVIPLSVGDVIVCDGRGDSWGSDPAFVVLWQDPDPARRSAGLYERLMFIEFHPASGHWMVPLPDPRYIEAID